MGRIVPKAKRPHRGGLIRINQIRKLRSFLGGKRSHWRSIFGRAHNLHLLPVIGQLFAAVEADYIRASHARSGISHALLDRDWEAVTSMPATEERIINPRKHPTTSHSKAAPEAGAPASIYLLRFSFAGKGSTNSFRHTTAATVYKSMQTGNLVSGALRTWLFPGLALGHNGRP